MEGRLRILTLSILAALIVLPLSLKPRPAPADDPRETFREVVGEWGYLDNTDSPLFWRLADNPALLFEEGQVRQSRPVFVMFGWAARWVVAPFVTPTPEDQQAEERIGFTILNVAILATSLGLMTSILRRAGVNRLLIVCGGAILAVNLLTRTFYWTAHTQILTLLAGTLLTYVAFHSINGEWSSRRRFLVAVGLGTLCLTSGLFFVGLPILWISGEVRRRRAAADFTRRTLGRETLLGASFFAPVLSWVAIANAVAGSFYSHETAAYRQYVWMLDALSEGGSVLASKTAEYLTNFTKTVISAEVWPILGLAAVAAIGFLLDRRWNLRTPASDVGLASLMTLGLLMLFVAFMGFYRVRITAVVLAPALILVLSELQSRGWARHPAATLTLGIATSVWVLLHFATAHPYS